MADLTIKTSGNEVFNGNPISLRVKTIGWTYNRITKSPATPGNWKPNELDSVGFTNPTMTINGIMNLQNTHATNETGSVVDFHFLNEFIAASGVKILTDDTIKATDNSDMFVEATRWNFTVNADEGETASLRSATQPYRLELIAASGTVWWSGTGIIT